MKDRIKKISFLFKTRKADQGVGCTSVLFPETELLLLKSACAESILLTSRGCVNASLSHNDFYKITIMASVSLWGHHSSHLKSQSLESGCWAYQLYVSCFSHCCDKIYKWRNYIKVDFFWLIVYVESIYDNTVQCVWYGIVAVVRQLVTLPVQSGSREN